MNRRVHIYCNVPGNKLAKLVGRRPEVLTGSRQMSLVRVTYFESRQIDFLSSLAETWHTLTPRDFRVRFQKCRKQNETRTARQWKWKKDKKGYIGCREIDRLRVLFKDIYGMCVICVYLCVCVCMCVVYMLCFNKNYIN